VFSNVSIQTLPASKPELNPTNVRSNITVYDLETKSVHVAYSADELWEAPNWSPDGEYLLANSGGAIYRFALDLKGEAKPEKIALDSGYDCNNDKGLSLDGKWLAFSAEHAPAQGSQVFVANADGTSPKLLTPNIPSYFHGWSPDGRWLAFVAERGGNFDIYRVSASGGPEERLTSSPGFDDGPDYSPDGKWIYINSDRSGGWDIWRFPAEGAGPATPKLSASRATPRKTGSRIRLLMASGWSCFRFHRAPKSHDFKTAVALRMIPMPASGRPAQPPKDEDSIQIPDAILRRPGLHQRELLVA